MQVHVRLVLRACTHFNCFSFLVTCDNRHAETKGAFDWANPEQERAVDASRADTAQSNASTMICSICLISPRSTLISGEVSS